jgi:Fur family ferric uptake transcriptional regulator
VIDGHEDHHEPVDWIERLREHGLQVTAQRLAVLRAVSSGDHGTALDVVESVRAEIGSISRQSVYDTLGLLADHDIIRRIQPAGSPARFEARVGDNHHHLVCRRCGRMVDVDCAIGEVPCLTPSDDWSFDVDEAEVTYWGLCPDCRTVAPNQRRPTTTSPPAGTDARTRTTSPTISTTSTTMTKEH